MKLKAWMAWLESRRDSFMDVIRIYLGLGLFVKGVFFFLHPERLGIAAEATLWAGLVPWVPYVHMAGGLLLAAGLLTRLAALAQMPILLSAIVFVHLSQMGNLRAREGFELSVLVLFLLVLIFLRGPGPLALSRLWRPERICVLNRLQQWADAHPDVFLDIIRAYLGVGLVLKGFFIMANHDQLMTLAGESSGALFFFMIASHYVIPAHFAGGAMMAAGFATRLATVAQIPLLVGAVFYVYLPRLAMLELRQNLEFTALVLFLLILIAAHGAGRFSLDHLLNLQSRARALRPQPAR
jgi:uncharacterized membrane protein YphA (DoxX/SURF4 family)